MRTWPRAAAFEIEALAWEKCRSNRISHFSLICLFFIHLFIQLTSQQMFYWIPKLCQGHGDTKTTSPSAWSSGFWGTDCSYRVRISPGWPCVEPAWDKEWWLYERKTFSCFLCHDLHFFVYCTLVIIKLSRSHCLFIYCARPLPHVVFVGHEEFEIVRIRCFRFIYI